MCGGAGGGVAQLAALGLAAFYVRYFEELSPTRIDIAAVPKAGGAYEAIRLDVRDPNWRSVYSWAMDADHWYVSHDNYFGAAHAQCVSQAPKSGGVLEDVWCPEFIVLNLLAVPGQLFWVNPWPGTTAPLVAGTWDIVQTDVASGQRVLLDRSGPQEPRRGARLVVDAGSIFFTRDGEVLRMVR